MNKIPAHPTQPMSRTAPSSARTAPIHPGVRKPPVASEDSHRTKVRVCWILRQAWDCSFSDANRSWKEARQDADYPVLLAKYQSSGMTLVESIVKICTDKFEFEDVPEGDEDSDRKEGPNAEP